MEALDALDQVAGDQLARSIDYMHGGTPRSCGHPADPLWVCALHPGHGLTCPDCLTSHLRGRHTYEEEHRCDCCAMQEHADMVPLLVKLPRPRWMRPPRAAKVRNHAAVLASGFGFCRACAASLGFPVGEAAR